MIDDGCLKTEAGPPKICCSGCRKSLILSFNFSPFSEGVAIDYCFIIVLRLLYSCFAFLVASENSY